MGQGALANAIARSGGFRSWATRLGLPIKESETKTGQAVELLAERELVALGYAVTKQTTKAPFDLLVSGVRVDVKSANYSKYVRLADNHISEGYFFGISKREPTCDLYILYCIDASGGVTTRYYVPSEHAKVSTLTITPTGRKYARFKDEPSWLDNMISRGQL